MLGITSTVLGVAGSVLGVAGTVLVVAGIALGVAGTVLGVAGIALGVAGSVLGVAGTALVVAGTALGVAGTVLGLTGAGFGSRGLTLELRLANLVLISNHPQQPPMNQNQDDITTMFQTTVKFLDQFEGIWKNRPAFVDAVSRAKSGTAQIRGRSEKQQTPTEGVTALGK